MYRRFGKRLFDLVVVLVSAPLWLPVCGLAALAVLASIGRPVLFRQQRPGRGGRPFTIFKLRTMNDRCGPDWKLLPDAERLTRVGRLLRAASLDELPELLNVIRGDMSLVGPRPLLMQYLERYSPEQARRHEVLPGITGWAQVNGRNALSWDEKFRLDVWYVDNLSFSLDLATLIKTAGNVITRRGISAEGHATMPEFRPSGQHLPKVRGEETPVDHEEGAE